jgi:hypothetical protein
MQQEITEEKGIISLSILLCQEPSAGALCSKVSLLWRDGDCSHPLGFFKLVLHKDLTFPLLHSLF